MATLETISTVSPKVKYTLHHIPHFKFLPKSNENIYPLKDLHMNVYLQLYYHSKLRTAQMSINWYMEK